MKLPTLLLVASLVANVTLFAVYRNGINAAGRDSARDSAAAQATRGASTSATVEAEPEEVLDDKFWKPDRPEDLASLTARLRAAGFPRYAVRIITMVQLDEMFLPRVKEILPGPLPFWVSDQSDEYREKMIAVRLLQKEHMTLMRQLLGPDATSQSSEIEYFQSRRFGDLPPERVSEINKVASDYNDLRQDIYMTSNFTPTAEDREKLAYLEKEMQADIAKLLTPEELEEYNVRNSSTALLLRFNLSSFKPNEEEFRAIFRVQHAFDDEMGGPPTTSAQYNERRARQAELDAKIEPLLSPERFAEYKVATNPAYMQINRVIARFDLPMQSAVAVDDLRKAAGERTSAIAKNASLTAEQRQAQLAAIAQEMNVQVEAILGPKATAAYKEYGGQWLQNIAGSPASSAGNPSSPSASAPVIILR